MASLLNFFYHPWSWGGPCFITTKQIVLWVVSLLCFEVCLSTIRSHYGVLVSSFTTPLPSFSSSSFVVQVPRSNNFSGKFSYESQNSGFLTFGKPRILRHRWDHANRIGRDESGEFMFIPSGQDWVKPPKSDSDLLLRGASRMEGQAEAISTPEVETTELFTVHNHRNPPTRKNYSLPAKACIRHFWIRVGECVSSSSSNANPNTLQYPHFREEPRYIAVNRYNWRLKVPENTIKVERCRSLISGPILTLGSLNSLTNSNFNTVDLPTTKSVAKPPPFHFVDPRKITAFQLLTVFLELLHHYNIRYWIDRATVQRIKNPFPCDGSVLQPVSSSEDMAESIEVCVDWYSIWILSWISKVYHNLTYELYVEPMHFVHSYRGFDRPQAIFTTARTQLLTTYIAVVGYSPPDNNPDSAESTRTLMSELTMEQYNPHVITACGTVCCRLGRCQNTSELFPIRTLVWNSLRVWVTKREWARLKQQSDFFINASVSPVNLLPYQLGESMVERHDRALCSAVVVTNSDSLASHFRWVRLGEPLNATNMGSTSPYYPPFLEVGRFVPVEIYTELRRDRKFFKEARAKNHLDARFYHPVALSTPQKILAELRTLFLEFSTLLDYYNVPYWIDFGSLLGWYWHQGPLPWDDDIDIGVLTIHLHVLKWISRVYQSEDYLLEVNPHFVMFRDAMLGNNVIDGRFISKRTGVFIDIIGYTPLIEDSYLEELFFDEIGDPIRFADPNRLYVDKVRHDISHKMLFPLKRANWSGIASWIPNDPVGRIHKVYGGMSTQEYGRHRYNWLTRRWEPIPNATITTITTTTTIKAAMTDGKLSVPQSDDLVIPIVLQKDLHEPKGFFKKR